MILPRCYCYDTIIEDLHDCPLLAIVHLGWTVGWNSPPLDVTSTPTLTGFRNRFKTIDRESTGLGGSTDPPLFQVGVEVYLLTPIFNVQSMFSSCLDYYHAPSTPFTPSISHTKFAGNGTGKLL